jgi:hypothetical protein
VLQVQLTERPPGRALLALTGNKTNSVAASEGQVSPNVEGRRERRIGQPRDRWGDSQVLGEACRASAVGPALVNFEANKGRKSGASYRVRK